MKSKVFLVAVIGVLLLISLYPIAAQQLPKIFPAFWEVDKPSFDIIDDIAASLVNTGHYLSDSATEYQETSHNILTRAKDVSDSVKLVEVQDSLPLYFEVNQGQADPEVKFLSRDEGYALFLTPAETVFLLRQTPAIPERRSEESEDSSVSWTTLRMKLIEANPEPHIVGVDELPGKVNYFIGNDPRKWRTNVPTYAKVKYEEVYTGIDMVFYDNRGELEYDFVISPRANPNDIVLSFEQAEKLEIDTNGDLIMTVGNGEIRHHKPRVYQDVGDFRQELDGNYVFKDQHTIGFQIDDYDSTKSIIIDPILVYSTYLGGRDSDYGYDITVDSAGNAYLTGETWSSNFPTANPFQPTPGGVDAFITKLNPSGSALVYSTYLGGGGADSGYGIAVDSFGNAYITGETFSTNFPTANPFQAAKSSSFDAFVTKLNPSGSALVYSTYLGGSSSDYGYGIDVDSSGNAYVTGGTSSTNFPTANPLQAAKGGFDDVFVTKLSISGSTLIYSTYLGGSILDRGESIAVDSAGNAYLTGETWSSNFPTANPFQPTLGGSSPIDAFVTKMNPSGSALVYSTYLGGRLIDRGHDIDVDSSGNAYVTGGTSSTNFPTANPLQAAYGGGISDAFVTKMNPSGSALVYSTYLGGSSEDYGYGIAVDSSGSTYITGDTETPCAPTLSGEDALVMKLSPDGATFAYSLYLGGRWDDHGQSIAVDALGNAYVTGETFSTDFPMASPLQPTYGGGISDAFVTKIVEDNSDHSLTPLPPLSTRITEDEIFLWTPLEKFDIRLQQSISQIQENHRKRIVHSLVNYGGHLTPPTTKNPLTIALDFLESEGWSFNPAEKEFSDFYTDNEYQNRHTKITYLTLQQRYRRIPIFQAQLRFGIDDRGRTLSVGGNYYSEIDSSVTPLLTPTEALQIAAQNVAPNVIFQPEILSQSSEPTVTTVFQKGSFDKTDAFHGATLVIFPMEYNDRLAWQAIFHKNNAERYLILVDARTGELLFRVNLVNFEQPQGLVFEENPDDTPQILKSFEGDPIASPEGWLFKGVGAYTYTSLGGNNVCAREDRHGYNNVGGLDTQDGYSPRNLDGHFEYPFQNAYENSGGTDVDTDLDAAITNLFYMVNFIHDYYYALGFDETAGNFQTNNFGRGGRNDDEVQAEAQDSWYLGVTNNANFYTPPDGGDIIFGKPRMQVYLFNEPSFRNADGDFDGDVIIHEYTHGLSLRLVGGPNDITGLFGNQSGAMGEGFGDWFAASIYNDSVIAEYATGNTTVGIRRYALDNNPLTYGSLCTGEYGCEVHDDGEIWSATLWDLREAFINRYGYETGKQKVEQLVVDAMSLSPVNPSMLDMRNFTLAADVSNNNGANQDLIWWTFACRGMGFSAFTIDHNDPEPLEAFNAPNGSICSPLKRIGIPLQQGWNLISMPFSLENRGISEVLSPIDGQYSAVYAYMNGSWYSYDPSLPPSSNILTEISHEYGYWIHMKEDATLFLEGRVFLDDVPYTLIPGWNLLGYPFLEEQPITEAFASIMDDIERILTYDPFDAGNEWKSYDPDKPPFLNTLTTARPGQGYWVKTPGTTFFEGWESGSISSDWITSGTNNYRIQVTTASQPYGGQYHLTMDDSVNGGAVSLNELTTAIDFTDGTDFYLSFSEKGFGEEAHGCPDSWTSRANGDCVAFTCDGRTWYRMMDLFGNTNPPSYTQKSYDLSADSRFCSSVTSSFAIRFQQYDDYPIPQDGMALDNIRISYRTPGEGAPLTKEGDDGLSVLEQLLPVSGMPEMIREVSDTIE